MHHSACSLVDSVPRSSKSPAVAARCLGALIALGLAHAQEPVPGPDAAATPPAPSELKEMSLEELMNVRVANSPGTLIPTSKLKSPVSVTEITAEDIRLTPHRNLLDLIEVYVPGAMVFPHSEGRQLGMRGIISDRNLKFLVLVNGRNMNDPVHGGAYTEITNWDLNDIERVEVINGPGSVTYGPGAIAGVINITTKTAKEAQRPEGVLKYTSSYDSYLGALSYGLQRENFDLYAYFSMVGTEGQQDPKTYNMEGTLANGYGYIGTNDFVAGSPKSFQPNPFYGDFEDQPQYKAHVDMTFFKELRVWARYTTSGGNMDQRVAMTRFPRGLDTTGTAYDFGSPSLSSEIQNRQLTIGIENRHEFNEVFTLETMISPQYQEYERRRRPELGAVYPANTPLELQQRIGDRNSAWNKQSNFGEETLFGRVLGHFDFGKTKAALGAEYSYNRYGPKWGDGQEQLRMGDNQNYVSGPDSDSYTPFFDSVGLNPATFGGVGTNGVFVGDGWSSQNYALLGELSLEQIPWFNVLLSGRIDKNSDSDFLYSPRLAIVSELDPRNFLKFTAQQSVRMNTAEQLYASRVTGDDSENETLRSLELTYETVPVDGLRCFVTPFYHELEATGFVIAGTAGGSGGVTSFGETGALGVQKTAGLEIGLRYSGERFDAGINHSFVKQLDFERADGINATSISYSDYGVPIIDPATNTTITTLRSTGNDINNWANNATKAYLNVRLAENLIFHTDARVYWGYEGAKDMIPMMEDAIAAPGVSAAQRASVQDALDDLEREDAWGIDFRLNASLTYQLNEQVSVSLFVQNLLGTGDNKRYQHDIGAVTLVPRAFYTEEPRTFGVMAKITY